MLVRKVINRKVVLFTLFLIMTGLYFIDTDNALAVGDVEIDGVTYCDTFGGYAVYKCKDDPGRDSVKILSEITETSGKKVKVTTIWNKAFEGCKYLKKVDIPNSVKTIEEAAFKDCISLESITIPKSVESIGEKDNYSWAKNPEGAFQGCKSLKEVTIQHECEIGKSTFADCDALTKISLPNVGIVCDRAFGGCDSLEEVNIPKVKRVEKNTFYYCKNLKNLYAPKVESIGSNGFHYCALEEVSMPMLEEVGDSAFTGCKELKEVHAQKLKSIGGSAFYGCEALESIDLSRIESIGEKAFYNCALSEEIVLPYTLRELYLSAFEVCKDVKKIILHSDCIEYEYKKSEEQGIEVIKHNYSGVETKKPTCVAEGLRQYECADCDLKHKEIIPIVEHDFVFERVIEKAVNGKKGKSLFICKACGKNEEREFDPCSRCNGYGFVEGEKWVCAKCGSDKVRIDTGPIKEYTDCKTCYGDGIEYKKFTKTCETCNGRNSKCVKCSGTGKTIYYDYVTCSKCKGKGKAWEETGKYYYDKYCGDCHSLRLEEKSFLENCSSCGGNDCTIKYDANGGTGAPDSQTIKTCESVNLSSKVPERTAKIENYTTYTIKTTYTFLGWSTIKDPILQKLEYKAGQTVDNIKENTVLYAIWDEDREYEFIRNSDNTKITTEGDSFNQAHNAITASKSDEGPAGTKYAPLQLKSTTKTKTTAIGLSWKKIKGATIYVAYGNLCGKKNKMKKIATSKGKAYVIKKISGKKLKKGKYYKILVIALDKNDKVISSSKVIHVATKGGKYYNHSKVTVTKKVIKAAKKMKVGKTLKLKAKAVAPKGIKVKKHRSVKYESTNNRIATVSKTGKVKAKKKGTCYIYAYAQNGLSKKVKVTVK